ncbi:MULTISPECIES: hypothetical protein [unclassified Micromonospora]|uniref:hypothetical protein n=1 Tax=unclassified Micromonospora TaxID=2617518 RepID=UPI001B3785EA|nr:MULTISPECIES: hypothetical protein [unclassified Micromonospora]MBQ1042846.1 hypothetical protein [Micromonospora sp. C72]MBQ1057919.1 hypothetical protein [Micromonospora sp. C32]
MQPPAGSQVSRVPAQRTPPEQSAPPLAPAPAPVRPKRSLRTVIAVVAGVLALLCTGGAVVGFVLYDRATAPDQGSPEVVVASYIQYLVDQRNDVKAAEFECRNDVDLDDLRSLRDDLVAREQRFNTTISVSWENLSVDQAGDKARVRVDLVISAVVDEIRQSDRQTWVFETRRQGGWGVCTAQRAA